MIDGFETGRVVGTFLGGALITWIFYKLGKIGIRILKIDKGKEE